MKLAEQIEALRAAQGDALRLATVDVDLAFGDWPSERRAALRDLLLVAAVPHWFDAGTLRTLADRVAGGAAEVDVLLPALERLRCIEDAPERGEGARSVHRAARRALRQALAEVRPEQFVELSARAARLYEGDPGIGGQIEHLYHLLVADAERGAALCSRLGDRWSLAAAPQQLRALALALEELLAAGVLRGRARGTAQLLVLSERMSRGEGAELRAAAAEVRALLEGGPEPVDLARAIDLQGQVAFELGDSAEARALFEESLERLQALVREDRDADRRDAAALRRLHLLAVAHTRIADVVQWTAPAAALEHFDSAVQAVQETVERDPADAAMRRELAVALSRLGDVQRQVPGREAEGDAVHARALVTIRELVERDPENDNLRRDLALQLLRQGDAAAQDGRAAEALEAHGAAIEVLRAMVARDGSHLRWQSDLASVLRAQAVDLQALERHDAAELALREAQALVAHLLALQPGNAELQASQRATLFSLAALAQHQGRGTTAVAHLQAVIELIDAFLRQHPGEALWWRELAIAHNRLGQARETTGDQAGAVAAFAQAVATMEQALAQRQAVPSPAWLQDLEALRGWLPKA